MSAPAPLSEFTDLHVAGKPASSSRISDSGEFSSAEFGVKGLVELQKHPESDLYALVFGQDLATLGFKAASKE